MAEIWGYLIRMPTPLAVALLTAVGGALVGIAALTAAVRRHIVRMERLNLLLTQIGRHTRRRPVLDEAVRRIADLARASVVLIYLRETPADPLVLEAGWPQQALKAAPPYIDPSPFPLPERHQTCAYAPCPNNPLDLDPGLSPPPRSLLIAPIASQGVLGYLIAGWSLPAVPEAIDPVLVGIGEYLGALLANFLMLDALRAQAANLDTTLTALRRRSRAREIFVHGTLHDLRNPLQLVGGYLSLALDSPDLPPNLARDLRIALAAARRAAGLAEGLLEIDVPARRRLRIESISVAELAAAAVEQAAGSAAAAAVDIGTDVAPELPNVPADRCLLERILDNLIANALCNTPRGGRITVAAKPSADGSHVVLTVRNSGRGLPPDRMKALLASASSPDPPQDGRLGLWLTHRMVEAMGGILQGEGTPDGPAFSVHLPTRPEAKRQQEEICD